MKKLVIEKDDRPVEILCESDPVLEKLITTIGKIEISMRPDYFQSIVRSIIGQLISVAAADAIYNRLDHLLIHHITPDGIIDTDIDQLRAVGLSMRKVDYLRDLAAKVKNREIVFEKLHMLDDKEVIKQLTSIKGIGKWTAEMFLIFSLERMNVLALDDIGIQRGAKWLYQVDKTKRRSILMEKASRWDPYCTIASCYLWEAVHLNYINNYDSVDEIIHSND
ncbi:DNA-3-methyladenine glycosylase family protein [Virgibacillus byunsanensis]|uniref:DNA-3-methyladenine glycosylase II n=1 Tax=Virgibacillus byunsanensis TaxID=570945 RepID=A0ABW3LNR5_9BACI